MIPEVSVLLPVRGAAPHLRAALRTLRWQDLVGHEVVLIDDGIAPTARAQIEAIAARDPRVRRIPCDGSGLVAALNTGLAAARGRILARMDADDLCHPQRLSTQRAQLRSAEGAVVGCGVRSFPRHRVTPRWRAYEAWQNALVTPAQHRRDLFVESPLCHPSVMLRRDLLRDLGGYHHGDFPEDYDLWLRCAARGVTLCKVPRPLLLWRDGSARLTRTDSRYRPQAFRQLKARHLRDHFELESRGLVVWGAGEEGKALGRALVEVGVAPRCYVDIDPRKIGGRIAGAAVVSPADRPWRGDPAPLVVVAVGTPGARETVRSGVADCGLTEGRDFIMAA